VRGCVRSASRRDSAPYRRDDPVAYLVLKREGILELSVVTLGPDVFVPDRIDELRGHSNPVVDFADAPFDHVLAAELARDRPRIDTAPLVGERGLPRPDLDPGDGLQPRRQVFDEAIREVRLCGILAHVDERQNEHRARYEWGTRRLRDGGGWLSAIPNDLEAPGEQ
jgi:hypothetical protein